MNSTYKRLPGGVGNIGSFGDGVDANFIHLNGSRAQRRLLNRHLKREAAKKKTRKNGG